MVNIMKYESKNTILIHVADECRIGTFAAYADNTKF